MSFKVVKTVENGTSYISAVPEAWEKSGLLFWPSNSKALSARSSESSKPSADWTPIECVVKQANIKLFADAVRLEKLLTQLSDTEAEENVETQKQESRLHPGNRYTRHQVQDYNSMFSSTENPTDPAAMPYTINVIDSTDVYVNELQSREDVKIKSTMLKNHEDSIQTGLINENSSEFEGLQIPHDVFSNLCQIPILVKDVTEMKITLAQINAKLDKLLQVNAKQGNDNETVGDNTVVLDVNFPLATVEQIESLQLKLSSSDFTNTLSAELKKINGTDGNRSGIKSAYRLADHMFTREVLTNFTWTGISKMKEKIKLPFLSFDRIISIFFKIIFAADSRYNVQENENFFKYKLLKYSESRCQTPTRKRKFDDQKKAVHDVPSCSANVIGCYSNESNNIEITALTNDAELNDENNATNGST